MFFQQLFTLFETVINNAVTTVSPSCEVIACRFHLGQKWWRKIHSFGLRQYGKKDWGKSLLEDSIRTVAFTTGGSQRLLCVGHYIQSFEQQASGTVLRL